jgi:hypothetical protein
MEPDVNTSSFAKRTGCLICHVPVRQLRSVTCPQCKAPLCRECCEKQLLSLESLHPSGTLGQCMQCKGSWSDEFLFDNLSKKFLKGGNELGFSAHISAHIFYESEVDLLGRASVGGGWWGRYNKYGYRAPRRIVWPGGVCILVLAWTYGA